MAYLKYAAEVASAIEHYLAEDEGRNSSLHGRPKAKPKRKKAPKPLPYHFSIRIWGRGRFVRRSCERAVYAHGSVKYVHNCDVRIFDLYDLFAAAKECFGGAAPTMDWYVNPIGNARGAKCLVSLNSNDAVKTMFETFNSVGMQVVEVYTQDRKANLPQIHGGPLYCIPKIIPRCEMPVDLEEFRFLIQEKVWHMAGWSDEELGLNEKLGKCWYVSDEEEPQLPCRNSGYSLRPSRFRGITRRAMLVEEDIIGDYLAGMGH